MGQNLRCFLENLAGKKTHETYKVITPKHSGLIYLHCNLLYVKEVQSIDITYSVLDRAEEAIHNSIYCRLCSSMKRWGRHHFIKQLRVDGKEQR
jgi:hypothetical protein